MSDPFSSSKYIPRASGGDSLLNKEEFQSSNRQKPMPPKNATQFPDAVGKVIGHGSVWLFETMSHPFIVLRRSCQVSTGSTYHLTPFTLPTVVYQMSRNKPPAWVYKGFISSLLARGFNMVAENVLNEMTNWPLSGYLVCAPFYITSFVETVQSYGANDSPSLFEFFTEGITRLVGRTYHHTWLVPMWQLLVPTATFRLCHYTVQQVVSHLVVRFITEERNRVLIGTDTSVDGIHLSQRDQVYPCLLATFMSSLTAEVVMMPFETVLHRLYVQGTRVLTDNMDQGTEVLGVNFRYNGILDCFWQILRDEGASAFYKGFGAVVLQYFFHFVGLRLLVVVLENVSSTDNKQGQVRKRLTQDTTKLKPL
ncbi:mitochondrial outer membrane protein SLC25A46-like isoform X2 [Dreissena polymorpha]|uniref:mitochondrial outer membrane protein SLC25A46-like isoform X2 n=1 Tax=Dreissena polymorpha TaxID=45954 RepID=UPI0022651965|nr:mitochondrial outer membrane protein SLC25A46-like isoform X2 [Dreissena polymorpha]